MLELNESTFAAETAEGLVIVDFYAAWCGPCRTLAPLLEQLQGVKVVKVNTDDNLELATRFGVAHLPTLVYLKDGVEVSRDVGLQMPKNMQAKVDGLLMAG